MEQYLSLDLLDVIIPDFFKFEKKYFFMKLDIFSMSKPMANHINTLHSSPVGQLTEIIVVFVYFQSTTKKVF